MFKRFGAISIAAAILAAAGIAAALYYATPHDAPPVSRSVQNFTVADPAVPAPATMLFTAEGGTTSLEHFRGKLVILNFWATWCGPCIRELPSLQALSLALDPERARVVLVSQDRGGFERVAPFLDNLDISIGDSFVDEKLAFSRAAGVRSLPTTILIGPSGEEIGRLVGHAEWISPEALALIGHYLGD